jgi:hypothetical protein
MILLSRTSSLRADSLRAYAYGKRNFFTITVSNTRLPAWVACRRRTRCFIDESHRAKLSVHASSSQSSWVSSELQEVQALFDERLVVGVVARSSTHILHHASRGSRQLEPLLLLHLDAECSEVGIHQRQHPKVPWPTTHVADGEGEVGTQHAAPYRIGRRRVHLQRERRLRTKLVRASER